MTGLVAIVDIGKTHIKLHVLDDSGDPLEAIDLASRYMRENQYACFKIDSKRNKINSISELP